MFKAIQVPQVLASYPGPSGGERAWYTLQAHAPGDPRKNWGNRILSYTLRLSSIELHVMQNPRAIAMVTRLVTMETPAHAHAMYTRPFFQPPEGPGYEATQVPEWLCLCTFIHCICDGIPLGLG